MPEVKRAFFNDVFPNTSMSGRRTLPSISLWGNSSRLSTVIMFSVTYNNIVVMIIPRHQIDVMRSCHDPCHEIDHRNAPVEVENGMCGPEKVGGLMMVRWCEHDLDMRI